MKYQKIVNFRYCLWIIILFFVLFSLHSCLRTSRCCLGLPEFTHDSGEHREVEVEMRDGVRLWTDIYFPEGKGPWPVVLIRSPYNMSGMMSVIAEMFSHYGYVGIHQDVRGRFDSEGEWYFFLHERDDGIDTMEWLLKQPWHNSNIALFGQSYFAFTELAIADMLPPEVKTIVPLTISTDLEKMAGQGGMSRVDLSMGLAAAMYDNEFDVFNGRNFWKALGHFPAEEIDTLYYGRRVEWFHEFMRFAEYESSHQELARQLKQIPGKIDVPVMMISGWYDLFTVPQIEDFNSLGSREKSRIMIGPWAHFLGIRGDGDKEFPGAGYLIDYMPRILNWLNHYLRGEKLDEWGPVEVYAIGEDRWETFEEWPPNTETVVFYPVNAGESNSCEGGALLQRPSGKDEEVSYVYDPHDPVPTRGGNSLLMFSIPGYFGADPSSRDQDGLCERDDVLTFISEPLNNPLKIRGEPKVTLTVSSNAEDTAFTAKLVEVGPDGEALNITDSIIRLAYRDGSRKALPYTPGQRVKMELLLPPIAWTLKPGYRLRLDVSSSNFPAYNAHSNRAGHWWEQSDPVKATQTVYAGKEDTSSVEIPVLLSGFITSSAL